MGIDHFAEQTENAYMRTGAVGAFRHSILQIWNRSITRIGEQLPYGLIGGENVYNHEWDVLILLDTCRPDAVSELAPEYSFLPEEPPVLRSVGTNSPSWIGNTFDQIPPRDLKETTYISANGHTDVLGEAAPSKEQFNKVFEVWRDGWDDDLGLVPPRPVTEAAVKANHQLDSERLIIHYMQPHTPYPTLNFDRDENREARWTVWNELKCGAITKTEAFGAYLDTLRWVLDDVALLLTACDFEKPVISADHAELFGEYGLYGHSPFPVPRLQRVPWIELEPPLNEVASEVSIEDVESVQEIASLPLTKFENQEADVDQQLRALGYKV